MKVKIQRRDVEDFDNQIYDRSVVFKKKGYGIYDFSLKFKESNFYCECGIKSNKKFFCHNCNTYSKRVRSYFTTPINFVDIVSQEKYKKTQREILNYELFLDKESGQLVKVNTLTPDKVDYYINRDILYGIDLYVDMFNDEVVQDIKNNIFIIPYENRVPVVQNNKLIVGDINLYYCELQEQLNHYKIFIENADTEFTRFICCYRCNQAIIDFYKKYIDLFISGKNETTKKALHSQKISCAIRSVIVNCPEIKEDEVKIHSSFANFLFPQFKGLWKNSRELNELMSYGHFKFPELEGLYPWDPEFTIANYSESDKQKVLKAIKETGNGHPWWGTLNRPPSISQLSMLGLNVIFDDNIGITSDKNEKVNCDKDTLIDIFSDNAEIGIDNCIIGLNPIIYSGLNADVDGDALFFAGILSDIPCDMYPSENFITISNGEVRNAMDDSVSNAILWLQNNNPDFAKKMDDFLTSKGV